MRRILLVLLSVTLLTVFVTAHPGRTDSNGGHYNRTTGEYHYHHGFPSHQHNNDICPYLDEQQDKPNSGGQLGRESSDHSDPGTIFLFLFWRLYIVFAAGFAIQQSIKSKPKSVSAFVFNGLLSLIQFFAMTMYAPLFLVSWITDKLKKNRPNN